MSLHKMHLYPTCSLCPDGESWLPLTLFPRQGRRLFTTSQKYVTEKTAKRFGVTAGRITPLSTHVHVLPEEFDEDEPEEVWNYFADGKGVLRGLLSRRDTRCLRCRGGGSEVCACPQAQAQSLKHQVLCSTKRLKMGEWSLDAQPSRPIASFVTPVKV